MGSESAWYDRFFRHEYLAFDEHPNTNLEVDFLLNTLQLPPQSRLLDLGCGYGRHTIPLAQNDLHVIGLDRSPELLQDATKHLPNSNTNVSFLRGDVRQFPFALPFDAIISMFSSFGYFDDENENFLVLQNISNALKSGGLFLIETANRDFIIAHNPPVQIYRPPNMTLIEERSFDSLTSQSLVDVTVIQDGEETHLHHAIRLYTATEMDMLLASVGLQTLGVWGDFHGSDFTTDSPHLIMLAEKV
ncbi:MAG: class I SAM-dependent methyltransferase [Candidatus Latescibacteria bacterium]|jgi:SAM-dependent methyltransferase|nr:class I SAM-dependent methyltransferase [Candidatus Latescibacterota bacterium]MBT4136527.1 class I SAM-dependent methyltransferase [Candidatus Latescibacterota bacterium]MBT5828999.1 class I SAM-dependent methyltransferase [Candidatus Latescibacterota bacterium]